MKELSRQTEISLDFVNRWSPRRRAFRRQRRCDARHARSFRRSAPRLQYRGDRRACTRSSRNGLTSMQAACSTRVRLKRSWTRSGRRKSRRQDQRTAGPQAVPRRHRARAGRPRSSSAITVSPASWQQAEQALGGAHRPGFLKQALALRDATSGLRTTRSSTPREHDRRTWTSSRS